jgi:hypothetical protein
VQSPTANGGVNSYTVDSSVVDTKHGSITYISETESDGSTFSETESTFSSNGVTYSYVDITTSSGGESELTYETYHTPSGGLTTNVSGTNSYGK